ncbi:DUF350 domain-containing protein [Aureispira anguillae]|uniref:DUF350 domain-containing protein n=1 Tax=Aureispira anguillae TaxID=2864201 RepID=A0A916DUC0_9BACT|nr:DUF350 domain-containing protein [Aureispira anguillae]BDS13206.1 DUF350 domain-containing protein [Aureispira anguillae]
MEEYLAFSYWGEPFIYMLVCFLLFLSGKLLYQALHKGVNVDAEMVDKDNLAFAITHVGYFVGLLLAICGAMAGFQHESLWQDLMITFGFGLGAIVLLNLAIIINDRIIFGALELKRSIIEKSNIAVGIVEAGNSITNGLIIFGVLSVEAEHVFVALIYWLVAQIIMVVITMLYNKVMPYDVFTKIYTGNAAVAVALVGFLIGIANIIRYTIETEHSDWAESAVAIGIQLVSALIAFPIFRLLTDKLLLPKRSITDELIHQEKPNFGVGLVEAFAYISASILIIISL